MLASATLFLITGGFIALGHDGRRTAQMLVLFLPAVLWLMWPVQSTALRRIRRTALWLLTMAFVADGLLRAYLQDAYQAAPDSAMVLGAMANTNLREASEYLQMHWRTGLMGAALWLATGAVAWFATAGGVRSTGRAGVARGHAPYPHTPDSTHGRAAPRWRWRWQTAAWVAALLLCTLALASKPWRRLHPLLFWPTWGQAVSSQQAHWADQTQRRAALLQHAQAMAPVVTHTAASTVVLMISESINRDNLQLYGYGRATSPRMLDMQRHHPEQMLVMRNAWSADATTLPAIEHLFSFAQPSAAPPSQSQHLIALARAAGYKVWWISNQDDIAIEQQHARLAHVVNMLNRTPGRASVSLDGELLAPMQEALDDPAERKFIIVHMLGAHPHYQLRYPQGQNPFDSGSDAIDAQMQAQGRAAWVRQFRQDYDAALLYHDSVTAESLRITQAGAKSTEQRAWMYLSDHGQEVGHTDNRAGHSPSTASGYRVPTIVWRNTQGPTAATALASTGATEDTEGTGSTEAAEAHTPLDPAASGLADVAQRPFRTDWAGWTLAHLLGLHWQGMQPERDALNPAYRWEPPPLPLQVPSFTD